MGQETGKYHVTDDGVVYRINDSGEITEMGNVNSLSAGGNAPASNSQAIGEGCRYTIAEMEQMLCNGKGNKLNRFERQAFAKGSNNIEAINEFSDIAGDKWLRIIINRFAKGETHLEPALVYMSDNEFGPFYDLALCKRPYSDSTIFRNIKRLSKNKRIQDALRVNPNSPYYDPDFKMPDDSKSGGCCMGAFLLIIVVSASLLSLI